MATVEPERYFTQAFQVQFLAVGQSAYRDVRTKRSAPTPDPAPAVFRSPLLIHSVVGFTQFSRPRWTSNASPTVVVELERSFAEREVWVRIPGAVSALV